MGAVVLHGMHWCCALWTLRLGVVVYSVRPRFLGILSQYSTTVKGTITELEVCVGNPHTARSRGCSTNLIIVQLPPIIVAVGHSCWALTVLLLGI